jgi:hypothetical protein
MFPDKRMRRALSARSQNAGSISEPFEPPEVFKNFSSRLFPALEAG